jgi:PAS domain S-box-containing protein
MDAVVATDARQNVVLFNRAAETLFGWPASEAIGQSLDNFLPHRFRRAHRAHMAAFGATGDTSRTMGHLRPLAALRRDGTEFPIEATISRVTVGNDLFYAAIVRDISERQAAEAERVAMLAREAAARMEATAAAAQRDSLREILDGLPIGVFIIGAKGGRIEFVNSAMVRLVFGDHEPPGALPAYGRDFGFLRADGTPLPLSEQPGLRALHGERVRHQQLLLERPSGERLAIASHAARLIEGANAPLRAIVVIQDVTQLRQAEQLKDDFLALISHEFRTPLTAIHGGAHLLVHGAAAIDDETRSEVLRDVVAESERLDRMLSNLLSLTNVMAGRLQAATEPVLIGPLARRVANDVGAGSTTHRFVVDVPDGVPAIEADPDLLEQVLRNLFENAVKYAPNGGEIRLTAGLDGGTVLIEVTDQGIGIAPEAVPQVFQRFRRVGGDPTIRGMGLGLYLSRHLIEAQAGTIEASSPGIGLGTTIAVRLPVAEGWMEE